MGPPGETCDGSRPLRHRLACRADIPALSTLVDAAIAELQKPFLDEAQITASRAFMGLDTQLIDDGTYFVVEQEGALAGCGGWSRRATIYGGDHSPGRGPALLDPAGTRPACAPCTRIPLSPVGVSGRLILTLCEAAAREEGFARVNWPPAGPARCSTEPAATRRWNLSRQSGGTVVPLMRMSKSL